MIDPRSILAYAAAAGLVLALGVAGTQTVRLANERAAHADTRTTHAQTLQRLADKATVAAHAAVQAQQVQQQALTAIDTLRTQEKTDALEQNEALRRDVAAGTRRVRVAGSCVAAGGRDVPQATTAPGLDPAPTVELTAAAGQDILDIRAGIIADQHALTALQEYVATVCPGPAP